MDPELEQILLDGLKAIEDIKQLHAPKLKKLPVNELSLSEVCKHKIARSNLLKSAGVYKIQDSPPFHEGNMGRFMESCVDFDPVFFELYCAAGKLRWVDYTGALECDVSFTHGDRDGGTHFSGRTKKGGTLYTFGDVKSHGGTRFSRARQRARARIRRRAKNAMDAWSSIKCLNVMFKNASANSAASGVLGLGGSVTAAASAVSDVASCARDVVAVGVASPLNSLGVAVARAACDVSPFFTLATGGLSAVASVDVSFTRSAQYASTPEGTIAIVACAGLLPPSAASGVQASVTVSPVDFEEILDSFAVRFGDVVFDNMMWALDLSLSRFIEEQSISQRTVSTRQIDIFERTFVDLYTRSLLSPSPDASCTHTLVVKGASPPRVH
jgi:hypothetical protein